MDATILKTNDYINFSLYNIDGYTKINDFKGYYQANKCLNGDLVLMNNNMCELVTRSKHILVGTLELSSKYKYGFTTRGHPIYLFHPYNKEYPQFLVASSEKILINRIAVIEFASWDIKDKLPRGNIIKILGYCGKKEDELISLKWLYGFPNIKLKECPPYIDVKSKKVFNIDSFTFNIDPSGCKEIDDVISIKKIDNNNFEIAITIADVAEHIIEGCEIDLAARKKGQTLYQNEKVVIPMIPPEISEFNASLIPGEERQGISLIFNWKDNKIENIHFLETVVKNNKSYNYDTIMNAEILLDKDTNHSYLFIIKDIASYLKGVITSDSHEWVEELMIFYNKEAAKLLVQNNIGLIRTHSEPEKEKLAKYINIDKELIYLAYESAEYQPSAVNKLHYGVNINSIYTHITSPLRRYADLVNQRFLKSIINKKSISQRNDIQLLAYELNTLQKKQKQFDRDVLFIEKISLKAVGTVEIIILENCGDKMKIYIKSWGKKITIHQSADYKEGEKKIAEYYINPDAPRWKEKVVFRIKK